MVVILASTSSPSFSTERASSTRSPGLGRTQIATDLGGQADGRALGHRAVTALTMAPLPFAAA